MASSFDGEEPGRQAAESHADDGHRGIIEGVEGDWVYGWQHKVGLNAPSSSEWMM